MLEPLICTAALILGGLVQNVTPPGTLPAAAMAQAADQKIICHIVSRDQTITIKSGPKGLLYSLTGTDGKILLADASDAVFAKMQPELYRHIRQSIAVQADASEAVGFAGLD